MIDSLTIAYISKIQEPIATIATLQFFGVAGILSIGAGCIAYGLTNIARGHSFKKNTQDPKEIPHRLTCTNYSNEITVTRNIYEGIEALKRITLDAYQ